MFTPARSFAGANIDRVREGMDVRVLQIEKSQRPGTRGARRVALRIEPVFSGWN